MTSRTQKETILYHLMNNIDGISTIEAFELYGITRLAAIILELKKDGYNIYDKVFSRKGKSSYYKRYYIEL